MKQNIMAASQSIGSSILTLLIALVPVFKACPPCPKCMPIYAAIFSLFGLELADYSHYLVPVLILTMSWSMGTMWYQIVQRQLSYHPLILGVSSCLLLLVFKYVFDHTIATYAVMSTYLFALIWHHHCFRRRSPCCG